MRGSVLCGTVVRIIGPSARQSHASCRLPTCGDREVSRRPQSCPTRLVRQAVRPAAAPKRAALAIPGRVRRVGRRPPLRSGYFGLRPQSRPCGPASASLPFAVRPLPSPASANPRAWLRRRGAGSSPRASFAARAPNRVRPSHFARRSADPPAPHITSCSVRRRKPLVAQRSRQSHERSEGIACRLGVLACGSEFRRGECLVTFD